MGIAVIENDDELQAIESDLAVSDPEQEETKQENKSATFLGGEQCAALCSGLFDVVAARRGERWKLKPDEAIALGGAVDAVLAKYIPSGLESFGEEAVLITVALAIALPRVKGDNGKA